MTRSSVFTTNKTQAVRLPKAVALPEGVKQVEVVKLGLARLIVPAGSSWDGFFESEGVSADFMAERAQPPMQERKGL